MGDPALYRQLLDLAVALVLGHLRPEDAVPVATALVEAGYESEAAVELASMPHDPKRVTMFEVEPLVRAMLDDFGVAVPSRPRAGWQMAGFVAEAMIDGTIDPAAGAERLWHLWDVCGTPKDELAWMLQLLDAWETSVGESRTAIEAEIVEYAPTVLAAARRHASS